MKLGRVKKTTLQIMQDRNYKVNESLLLLNDFEVSMHYLKIALQDEKCISLAECMNEKYGKDICLIFLDTNYDEAKKKEKMVCCEQAKNAIQKWKDYKTKYCIIISPGKMSPDAKKEFDVPKLTIMTHDFLSFAVGRHCMVPKHRALSEEEKNMFLEHRKIQLLQLPEIKLTDPVSMYYGFKMNQIIQIDRPSWTVYRVVTA